MRTMMAKDAVAASLAECYVTIDGRRYNFMQAIDLEAKFEKTKAQGADSRQTRAGQQIYWLEGSGSATFHYNSSVFRKLFYNFKDTGEDIYFDIQVTNEDPASSVGRQTVILKDCNLNGGVLAKFSASDDYLQESIDFTFEDFEMPETFKNLAGM